jgi:(p)ppGpp synthase/HD superfamily hydrolase
VFSYHPLVNQALLFAARAHHGQMRKGTDIPYLVHPVGVLLVLVEAGESDPALLAAALLHDTLEDTGVTVEALRAAFGERVAAIVAGCTEPFGRDDPWEVRKQHTVEHLRTAPRDVLLVAAADKLHNLESIVLDHGQVGDALWDRFNRGQPETAWYYRALAESLQAGELAEHPIVLRFARTVDSFFGREVGPK